MAIYWSNFHWRQVSRHFNTHAAGDLLRISGYTIFIHLNKTLERDRHTDRQTACDYYSDLHCEQCGHAIKMNISKQCQLLFNIKVNRKLTTKPYETELIIKYINIQCKSTKQLPLKLMCGIF